MVTGCSSKTEKSEEEKTKDVQDTIVLDDAFATATPETKDNEKANEMKMLPYNMKDIGLTFQYPSYMNITQEDTHSVTMQRKDGLESLAVSTRENANNQTSEEVLNEYLQQIKFKEVNSSFGENWYKLSGQVTSNKTSEIGLIFINGYLCNGAWMESVYMLPLNEAQKVSSVYAPLISTIINTYGIELSDEIKKSNVASDKSHSQKDKEYEVNQSQSLNGITLDMKSYYFSKVGIGNDLKLCVKVKITNETGENLTIVKSDFKIKNENGELIDPVSMLDSGYTVELASPGNKEQVIAFDMPEDINKVSFVYQPSFEVDSDMEFSFKYNKEKN
jgi:Telomeric repeat-binding factor 2.